MKQKPTKPTRKKVRANKRLADLPRVIKGKKREANGFPVAHYSASFMIKMCTNAILAKIEYINGDRFETAMSAKSVLGKAFHKAMEVYYGGSDEYVIQTDAEAVEYGLKAGLEYINAVPDGFVNWSKKIPTKQKMTELLAFIFTEYSKERPFKSSDTILATEEKIEEFIDIEWRGQRLQLPVKLKGYLDKAVRSADGKLRIVDYKTTDKFSDDDRIDGKKIIQAVMYYLLGFAFFGEAPHSLVYEEVKWTRNQDPKQSQVRSYELVFAENDLFFDFFFRLYEDITKALNGTMVFLPNLDALWDNELAIVAYINRLDVDTETAKLMKKHRVDNITDLLKRKIATAKSMRQLLKTAEKQFVSDAVINYKKMSDEQKIQTKLMEHGILISFDSKIEGPSVTLYQYTPSSGLKMSKIMQYAADIEQVLGTSNVRILAPIPGTSLIGFEVPRKRRNLLGAAPAARNLVIPIGIGIDGKTEYVDLKTAPHILVAGTTGAGKSATMTSMLRSIGGSAELWLMDPKMVELNEIPHKRYADSIEGIMRMLKQLTDKMDERYKEMKTAKVKEWQGKRIVAVIDEFGDITAQSKDGWTEWQLCEKHNAYDEMTKGSLRNVIQRETSGRRLRVKEQELMDQITYCSDCHKHVYPPAAESLTRLAAKGRAAGIHIILATQSPRVDVITGTIKANFPTRIALRTASSKDSEVILGVIGAEKLLGKGDLLLQRSGSSDLIRLQSYYAG